MTENKAPASGYLPPIPTPPSVWWSNIRARVLPLLTFLLLLGAVVYYWNRIEGGGAMGMAEGVRMMVTCPRPAFLKELMVQPYHTVTNNDTMAILQPSDPRTDLDLLQSGLQLARLKLQPSLAEESAIDYERLRVDLLRLRQEVAMAQVNLVRAESVLRRNDLLLKDRLVSQDVYDISLGERDVYRTEIAEKSKAMTELQDRLEALRGLCEPQDGTNNTIAIRQLVDLENRLGEIHTNMQELIQLKAPMEGMVHLVNHQPGEFVPEGEPIFTINSAKSDRIVGYLREPYPFDPYVGMEVEVRTRNGKRQTFTTKIQTVGAQLEVITNALAIVRPLSQLDAGLPIVLRIPENVHIRPGETVDIVKPRKRGFFANQTTASRNTGLKEP